MRKGILVILIFGLLLGLSFAQKKAEKKWAVALRDATVRSMPSTQGNILFIAKAGEKLEVLDEMGLWLKVKRADGAVGYIWAKLVRVEVERVVGQVQPSSRPVLKPAPRPSPRLKPFGFSFHFDYLIENPEDFNVVTKYNNYQVEYLRGRPGVYLSGALEELKSSLGAGVEFVVYPEKAIGLSLGFSFIRGHKGGEVTTSDSSGDYIKTSQDLAATIYGPYFSLHLLFNSGKFGADLFGSVGYYRGNFSIKNLFHYKRCGNEWDEYYFLEDISKGTAKLGAGFRMKFYMSQRAGIFLGASYQFLKFNDLKGRARTQAVTEEGELYYFEKKIGGIGWIPDLWVFSTSPPPSARNARRAKFNFSGPSASAGVFFRF